MTKKRGPKSKEEDKGKQSGDKTRQEKKRQTNEEKKMKNEKDDHSKSPALLSENKKQGQTVKEAAKNKTEDTKSNEDLAKRNQVTENEIQPVKTPIEERSSNQKMNTEKSQEHTKENVQSDIETKNDEGLTIAEQAENKSTESSPNEEIQGNVVTREDKCDIQSAEVPENIQIKNEKDDHSKSPALLSENKKQGQTVKEAAKNKTEDTKSNEDLAKRNQETENEIQPVKTPIEERSSNQKMNTEKSQEHTKENVQSDIETKNDEGLTIAEQAENKSTESSPNEEIQGNVVTREDKCDIQSAEVPENIQIADAVNQTANRNSDLKLDQEEKDEIEKPGTEKEKEHNKTQDKECNVVLTEDNEGRAVEDKTQPAKEDMTNPTTTSIPEYAEVQEETKLATEVNKDSQDNIHNEYYANENVQTDFENKGDQAQALEEHAENKGTETSTNTEVQRVVKTRDELCDVQGAEVSENTEQIDIQLSKAVETVGTNETNMEIVDTLKSRSGTENPENKKISNGTLLKVKPINEVTNTENDLIENKQNLGPDVEVKCALGGLAIKKESGHEEITKNLQGNIIQRGSNIEIANLSGNTLGVTTTEKHEKKSTNTVQNSVNDNNVNDVGDMEIVLKEQQAMTKIIDPGDTSTNPEIQIKLDYETFIKIFSTKPSNPDGKISGGQNSLKDHIGEYLKDFFKPLILEAIQNSSPRVPQNSNGIDKVSVPLVEGSDNIEQSNEELEKSLNENREEPNDKIEATTLETPPTTEDAQSDLIKNEDDDSKTSDEDIQNKDQTKCIVENEMHDAKTLQDNVIPKDQVDSKEIKPEEANEKERNDQYQYKQVLYKQLEKIINELEKTTEKDVQNFILGSTQTTKRLENESLQSIVDDEKINSREQNDLIIQDKEKTIDKLQLIKKGLKIMTLSTQNESKLDKKDLQLIADDLNYIRDSNHQSQISNQNKEKLTDQIQMMKEDNLLSIILSSSQNVKPIEKESLQLIANELDNIRKPNGQLQNDKEIIEQFHEVTETEDRIPLEQEIIYELQNKTESNELIQKDKESVVRLESKEINPVKYSQQLTELTLENETKPNDQLQNKQEPIHELQDENKYKGQLHDEKKTCNQHKKEKESNDQLQKEKEPKDKKMSSDQIQIEGDIKNQFLDEKESYNPLKNEKKPNDQLQTQKEPKDHFKDQKVSSNQLQNERDLNDQLQINKEPNHQFQNNKEPNDQLETEKINPIKMVKELEDDDSLDEEALQILIHSIIPKLKKALQEKCSNNRRNSEALKTATNTSSVEDSELPADGLNVNSLIRSSIEMKTVLTETEDQIPREQEIVHELQNKTESNELIQKDKDSVVRLESKEINLIKYTIVDVVSNEENSTTYYDYGNEVEQDVETEVNKQQNQPMTEVMDNDEITNVNPELQLNLDRVATPELLSTVLSQQLTGYQQSDHCLQNSSRDQSIEYLRTIFRPLIIEALRIVMPTYGREKELLQTVTDEPMNINESNNSTENKKESNSEIQHERKLNTSAQTMSKSNSQLQNEKETIHPLENETNLNDQVQNKQEPIQELQDENNYKNQLPDEKNTYNQHKNEKESNDQLQKEKEPIDNIKDKKVSSDQIQNEKDTKDQLPDEKELFNPLKNEKKSNDLLQTEQEPKVHFKDEKVLSNQFQNEKDLNDQLQNDEETKHQFQNNRESNDQQQNNKDPRPNDQLETEKNDPRKIVKELEDDYILREEDLHSSLRKLHEALQEKLSHLIRNLKAFKTATNTSSVEDSEIPADGLSVNSLIHSSIEMKTVDTPNFESARIEEPVEKDEDKLLMDVTENLREMVIEEQNSNQEPSEAGLKEEEKMNDQTVDANDSIVKTTETSDLVTTVDSSDVVKIKPLQEQLRFHDVHGDNIRLSKNNFRAQRMKKSNFFSKGIAFSCRPVAIGEKVSIHLKQLSSYWLGLVTIGFTTNDPMSIADNLPTNVIIERDCADGFWAEHLDKKYYQKSCRLHYYLNSSGNMCFGVNGVDKIEFLWNLDTKAPVWAFIDLFGYFTIVEFDVQKEIRNTSSVESRLLSDKNESGNSFNRSLDDNETNKLCLNYQIRFVPLDLYTQFEGSCMNFLKERGVCITSGDKGGCIDGKFPLFPGQTIVVQNLSTGKSLFTVGVKYGNSTAGEYSKFPEPVQTNVMMHVKDELAITFTEMGEVRVTKNLDVPKTILKSKRSQKLWPFVQIFKRNQKIKFWSSNTPSLAAFQI